MPIGFSRQPRRHVFAIDELLLPKITGVQLFMTHNTAAFLALPHAFPGKWEQARELLEPSGHHHRAHMHTLPYQRTNGISLSSWHHGDEYQTIISGRPESIARYTEQTENERERYLLECVRQNASGNELLAVAELKARHPIDSVAALTGHNDFRLMGTMTAHRTANSAQLIKLRALFTHETQITLVSREHVAFIQSFVARHGLFPAGATYVDAAELPGRLTEVQIAELDNASGVGHCESDVLRDYFAGTDGVLSPEAKSLVY